MGSGEDLLEWLRARPEATSSSPCHPQMESPDGPPHGLRLAASEAALASNLGRSFRFN